MNASLKELFANLGNFRGEPNRLLAIRYFSKETMAREKADLSLIELFFKRKIICKHWMA